VVLSLCDFGCVVTTAELLAAVRQDSVVDIYLQSAGIQRVRRGLHACAHVGGDALAALRCGGVLDCVSALEAEDAVASAAGVELPALHVRFRRGDHWARSRIAAAGRPVAAHWHEWRGARRTALSNRLEWRNGRPVAPLTHVPPAEALAQALICVAPAEARRIIAVIAEDRLLPEGQIDGIIAASPRRVRQALRD
jgi:hypothetical protein